MKIAIRTDASRQIGTGHVMRCLALAEVLRERGAEIHFIARELQGNILEAIRQSDHRLHVLPAPVKPDAAGNSLAHAHWLEVSEAADADQTLAALETFGGVNLLVVDHYALAAVWEKSLRAATQSIFVLDDLADRPHDCDLLLDQTPDAGPRYEQLVPARCRVLAGPSYALLRSEFAQWHRKTQPGNGEVRRLLVCFGGVDAANYSGRVVEAVRLLKRTDVLVDVVAGMANPHVTELRKQCADVPNVRFLHAPLNLAELMAQADLAVGAGGVMLWERACLGLPTVAVVTAENQRPVMKALAASGQIVALEAIETTPDNLARTLDSLIAQPALLQTMSQLNHEQVDGRGCERVVRSLMPLEIRLRLAEESDRDSLFHWRNDDQVRRFFYDPAPVKRATHENWFAETMKRADRQLLIAESSGAPAAVLRYDLAGSRATVSIYLVPGQNGRGLGSAVLRAGSSWLRTNHPAVREIIAEVLPANVASQRAFLAAGYVPHASGYRLEFTT